MLVTTGGCATEIDQLQVAFTQLTEQGMHLLVRSTLVRMMALFGAMHCYTTPSWELVEFRQNYRLYFQQQLIACMVGTLHTVASLLPYVHVLMHTKGNFIYCHTCVLNKSGLMLMCISSASSAQAHPVKQVLPSTLSFSQDTIPHLVGRGPSDRMFVF